MFVRSHDTRSLEKNREIAWKRLTDAVDVHLNGEDSVVRQIQRLEKAREERNKEARRRHREKKAQEKLALQKQLEEENRGEEEDINGGNSEAEEKPKFE